jgi:glyoxylase-like metal-dependent hydrolase (beta-lactamase superfamily II)
LSLHVVTCTVGPFQENCFIVWSSDTREALLIDPGDEPEVIARQVERNNLQPLAILNTHAHLDHIGAVAALRDRYQIPFYLNRQEESTLRFYPDTCRLFGLPPQSPPTVDHWFDGDTDSLSIGDFTVKVLFTPGHTPGGTCFLLDDQVFVGDTLFRGSVGRTDLPGGDWPTLEQSLRRLVSTVPPSAVIHPGHGPDTTLAVEIRENPFLISLQPRVNSTS